MESPCLFQRNSFHLPGSITATTSHGPPYPVYNFWYHPMETTPGHLWGIFYTFLLLFQGSLFFTQLHLNSWWRLSLEMLVLPHAVTVAVNQRWNLLPMFVSGLLSVFVITQMHSHLFSSRQRWMFSAAIAIGSVFMYWKQPVSRLNEPLRIPLMDYAGVLILACILFVIMRCHWTSCVLHCVNQLFVPCLG